ncbi:MAG: hypothetical protein FWF73_08175 [Spirochaetes bacterium]|nr:hypothetical protein [Spirochaetota bacterium]
MNYIRLLIIISSLFLTACISANKNDGYLIDSDIIVLGKSAEGYSIGDTIIDNGRVYIINTAGTIGEILEIDLFSNLTFDSIIYNKDQRAIFINSSLIIAIVGLNPDKKITYDAIALSMGIDKFILNYGESELEIISKENSNIYLYKKLGIALFDDNKDGTIDMYIIFSEKTFD